MTKNLNKKPFDTHQPSLVQNSGLLAYDYIKDDLNNDIKNLYANSKPTNRKGRKLGYYNFIYYNIGDRYFDIDDGDLFNFDILGHFAFKIISHVTTNTKKSALLFYRTNEVLNLSNISKTEKMQDNFIRENV